MATNGNDSISFSGTTTLISTTLTNAYSGYELSIDEEKNLNDSIYNGLAGQDTLIMTSSGDALFLINDDGDQTIQNIETIFASTGGDVIDLSHETIVLNDMVISGSAGEDVLWANAGDDTLVGGDGNDILDGGPGNDLLIGGAGDDIVFGGAGDDILFGNQGNDYYEGGSGSDEYQYNNFTQVGPADTIVETEDGAVDSIVFTESGSQNVTLADLSFDVSGNDLIITVTNSDTGDTSTISLIGQYDSASSGIDQIVFADGIFDLRTIQQNVDPDAVDDAFSGDEDSDITGNVLTNDSDDNGDSLSVTPQTITTSAGATVELLANGDFTYTPVSDFNGADSFEYTVSDGNGGFDTGAVDLTVNAVNDDPVAGDDAFSGDEDADISGNVLGNDSDVDGDALSVVAETITTAAGGTVELLANGDFTYTPLENFNGADSFEYTVSDGNGGADRGTVTLDIADMPDAVSANLDIRVSYGNTAQTYINSADGYDLTPGAYGVTESVDNDTMDVAGASANAQVSYNFADADTAEVTLDTAWNSMKNVEVSSDSAGSITLNNFVHTDVAFGDGGDSTITITDAKRGFITTGDGNDTVTIDALTNNAHWSNIFDISSGAGNDVIDFTGDKGISEVRITAGSGNDDVTLHNDYQTSTVKMGAGNDTVNGGTGQDSIFGGDGDDFVDGGNGQDVLYGDAGDDTLTGGNGTDILYGGAGADTLEGGRGNDILYGGNNDVLIVEDKEFNDNILFPNVQERQDIRGLNPSGEPALGIKDPNLSVEYAATAELTFRDGYAGYNNSLGIYSIAEDGTIQSASLLWENVKDAGTNVAHTIDIPTGIDGGDYGFFVIADGDRANHGYNSLDTGDAGNIRFVYDYGGAGERVAKITDSYHDITLIYDDGTTSKALGGHVYHTTERGADADINADGKTHAVSGLTSSGNNDVLEIGFEDLYNWGDADFEDVHFDLNINENVIDTSEQSDDILDGGMGNDVLYGEGGDDILIGGEGADVLNGGTGADTFVFTTAQGGSDRVEDFSFDDGDALNITDILDGYDANSDDIDDFVEFIVNGNDTELHVNADGHGGDFKTIVVIENVVMVDSVDQMVADGTLIIDQSLMV